LRKSRRAAAEAQLMALAQRQAQFLVDARTYAADLATLNMSLTNDVSNYYTVSIAVVAGPPPSFTVTATPRSDTSQASDFVLGLDSSGAKTPAGVW
jgi:type IV pilus assembly protein PilE